MPKRQETDHEARRLEIRRLNDLLREHAIGNGSMVITSGVAALDEAARTNVISAVLAYNAFSEDNDPYGEHDFGAFEIEGEKFFWKIDYYDLSLTGGSPDPADEFVTHRVLTVMLASEY